MMLGPTPIVPLHSFYSYSYSFSNNHNEHFGLCVFVCVLQTQANNELFKNVYAYNAMQ